MRIVCAVAGVVFLAACSEQGETGAVAPEVATEAGKHASAAVDSQDVASEAKHAASDGVTARFERTDPSRGTLVLEETGATFVLNLVAGGRPSGAATAADCAVTIAGPQDNEGVVRGHVVPSSGAYGDMTADDIGPTPLKVDVMIGPEGAFVTDHGAAAKLCGMGSQLDGFYKRQDMPD